MLKSLFKILIAAAVVFAGMNLTLDVRHSVSLDTECPASSSSLDTQCLGTLGVGLVTTDAATNTVLDFDADAGVGEKDYVVIADNAVLDQANRLSLSVWIEPDNAPGAGTVEYILYRHDNYYLKIDEDRKIVGSVHTDAERITSASAITADGAAWTHIEMTYDREADGDTDLKLYINGVLDATANYSTAITASADALYIGSDSTPANWFDGQIDAVRLYQYARSASDVRLDYNEGCATYLGARTLVEDLTFCADDPASCMDYGLVGSWNMDEGTGDTAYDVSDEGNDGTLGGGDTAKMPKWTTDSPPLQGGAGGGSSLQFDGVNDYVDCGSDESLDITEAITIEAWVKLVDLSGAKQICTRWEDGMVWQPYVTSNVLRWRLYIGGSSDLNYTLPSSVIGKWIHVTFTHDKDVGAKLFVDGEQKNSNSVTGTMASSSGNVFIGTYRAAGGENFNGSIDSVRIYNRALSADEVRYHYNRGGPVAEWNFDEGEGQTAYDESSNDNDGQLGATAGVEGSDPTWVEGKYGGALSFDGGDYVDCGSGSSLDITEAITVGAWVKRSSIDGTQTILIKWSGSGNLAYYFRFQASNLIELGHYDGVYHRVRSTTAITSLTDWYHLVGVFNGTHYLIYINGVLNNSAADSTTISSVTGHLVIGRKGEINSDYFNGSIDSVRIYNRALSAEEVRKEYNGGKGVWFR